MNEENPTHYLKIIDPCHVTAVEVTFWERDGEVPQVKSVN